jgi:hypothetical protein
VRQFDQWVDCCECRHPAGPTCCSEISKLVAISDAPPPPVPGTAQWRGAVAVQELYYSESRLRLHDVKLRASDCLQSVSKSINLMMMRLLNATLEYFTVTV